MKNSKHVEFGNIENFVKLTHKYSNSEIAKIFDADPLDIFYLKQEVKKSGYEVGSIFPLSPSENCDNYLRLVDDRVIIIGDCEIPDHDPLMFEMVIELATVYNVKTLIINGDFVALDLFSNFKPSKHNKQSFRGERKICENVLGLFSQYFENIYYISGNHEKRLVDISFGEVNMGDFLESLEKVTFSEHWYCELTCGDEEYVICHPTNYSKNPLKVPQDLASIHLKHIVAGHTHRLSQGRHVSDKFWIIDSGHCRDVNKTGYKKMKINTHPNWNQGFVFLLDGNPHLIDVDRYRFFMSPNSYIK